MLNGEKRWPQFKQTVDRLIREVASPEPSYPGLPESMPLAVFHDLFPVANPNGPVTKFYIDYCTNHLPDGEWPRFNGVKTQSDGSKWFDFNPLHIFTDPTGSS